MERRKPLLKHYIIRLPENFPNLVDLDCQLTAPVQSCSPQPTQSFSLVPTSCFLKRRASRKDPSSFRLGIIIVGKEIFRILCVRRSGRGQQDSLIVLDRKYRSTGKSLGGNSAWVTPMFP